MKIRRQYDESKLLQVKRRRFRGENSKMDVGNVNSDLDGLETKFELNSVFVSASRGGPSYKPEVTDSKFNNDIVTDSIPMLKRMREMLNSNIARGETSLVFNSGDSIQVASDEDFSFTHANILDSSMSTTSSYSLFLQILFPFVPAGLGMVFAGFVLDIVQHWNLFIEVPETFILVPALLGLKGNLEMTFASRLSTLANMGRMNSNPKKIIVANLALIQVQAIVVAFLASSFAVTLAWIPKGQIDWSHASLLCASSLTTASLTSLVLSTVVICVVLISRNFDINPDNIATPIAASLGDLTTLGALSLLGSIFLHAHLNDTWLNVGVIVTFIMATPFWIYLARKDKGTVDVLENGWSPIIFSMLISSAGGFVLESTIKRFPKIAMFQPVINGVGGNLAAIQASRLATFYHQHCPFGTLSDTLSSRFSFRRAFFSNDIDAHSARVLLLFVVPCHMFFNWIIQILHKGSSLPSGSLFTSIYICAALVQVLSLLYVCQLLVAFLWSIRMDPDCAAIPYLTALGDLFGTFLLFLIFASLPWFNKGGNLR
ncbi:Divalent cation transporter family protein [Brugia malayi]|uniref:Bm4891 n=1 Tax=Brugia malayi TaxID=6279 RepID=A0A0K0JGL5_BRUMA|nr:Divalent cation transporter family protein [Brugia malayi]CRZ25874.1 Bm4891 [Brugia malayi]VIO86140.1 Divalent cation transporter family protein [Brugia malayi]